MQGDFSRVSFDRRRHYSGVLAQQGRVQLDAEMNEQLQIHRHREVAEISDLVGTCGAPKYGGGFLIQAAPGNLDLLITPGRYYVEGELCELEGTPQAATFLSDTQVSVPLFWVDGSPYAANQFVELSASNVASQVFRVIVADEPPLQLTLDPSIAAFQAAADLSIRRLASYLTQPDLPDPAFSNGQTPPGLVLPDGTYLAYLDVWQRHVTSLVDDLLREKALGGPDTTSRQKTIWQVKLWPGPGGSPTPLPDDVTCQTAVADFDAALAASTGRLSARTLPGTDPGPCIIPPGAGYLGLENQLYRVEIHAGGTLGIDPITFKWSRDNASVVKPIESIPNTANYTVREDDPDDVLGLASGQWVEEIDDAIELNAIARDLAQFAKDPATGVVTLAHPVVESRHPRVRRWDSEGIVAIAFPPAGDGWIEVQKGIQVRFEAGTYRTGDYWLIPARTVLGDIEWPRDASGNALSQPALGIHHDVCRLGVVHVAGGAITVDDCRPTIPPLNELRSCASCCTITVGDGLKEVGDYTSIQEAVNHLPDEGGEICILPGTYQENVLIDGRTNLHMKGCGSRTRIVSVAPAEGEDADAVIHVHNSTTVKIESLLVQADLNGVGILVDGDEPGASGDIAIERVTVEAGLRSGIEVLDSRDVSVEGCRVETSETNGGWPGIFFQAVDGLVRENEIVGPLSGMDVAEGIALTGSLAMSGLQLAGGCERVRVHDNLIAGPSGQGITLGSIVLITSDGTPGDRIGWVSDGDDPCLDCERPSSGDDPDDGTDGTTTLESEGDLADIEIKRNRIFDTGLDGIGVVHFFDLAREDRKAGLVRVDLLEITENRIERTVRREMGPIAPAMIDLMAYGGISLSSVEGLTIRDNAVEDVGVGGLLPVCGIFVHHGEGIEIERNRILIGGLGGQTPSATILPGRRGGIHLLNATVLQVKAADVGGSPLRRLDYSIQRGGASRVPPARRAAFAATVEENTVDVNRGAALVVSAVGLVSVVSNRLISRGLAPFDVASALNLASLVVIVDLGSSSIPSSAPNMRFAYGEVKTSKQGALRSRRRKASGKILFTDNQCLLALSGSAFAKPTYLALAPASFMFPSIFILSMDDVGFHDNQCETRIQDGTMPFANLILGLLSVRATANRLEETLGRASFSLVSLGWMNMTVNNQATHCLKVIGPMLRDAAPNHVLINQFIEGYCSNIDQGILDLLKRLLDRPSLPGAADSPYDLKDAVMTASAKADELRATGLAGLAKAKSSGLVRLSREEKRLARKLGDSHPILEALARRIETATESLGQTRVEEARAALPLPEVGPRAWALHGFVFTADEAPMPGVAVGLVTRKDEAVPGSPSVTTDAKGYFKIGQRGVAASDVFVLRVLDGAGKEVYRDPEEVAVTGGQVEYREIVLPESAPDPAAPSTPTPPGAPSGSSPAKPPAGSHPTPARPGKPGQASATRPQGKGTTPPKPASKPPARPPGPPPRRRK